MKSKTQSTENLPDIILKAEKSVEEVKDQRLKEIAFAKALDFLLGSSTSETSVSPEIKKKNNKNRSTGKTKATPRKEGPLTWIRELVEENFFKEPKSSNEILEELTNRSHRLKATDITRVLETLCHEKLLRRNKQSSQDGGKAVFHWYNW